MQTGQWQENLKKLKDLAQNPQSLKLESELKHILESLTEQVRLSQNLMGWKAIEDLLHLIARQVPQIKEQMQQIALLEDTRQKKEALLKLLLEYHSLHFISEQIKKYLYVPNAPTVNALSHNLLSQSTKLADIAVNQNLYSPEGRIIQRLVNLLMYLLDLFCMKLGVPSSFLENEENERQKQSIMPLKI